MLNYELDGSGPPLLLIHGFGISFNIWANLRPLIRDHCTLIMVELPGIGRSPAPPRGQDYLYAALEGLEGVRRDLKIDRWHVLSYSSGTRVGERYVGEHGAHVQSAIFLCPAITAAAKSHGLRAAKAFDARHPAVGNWILSGWRLTFLVYWLGFSLRPNPQVRAWTREISSQPVEILKETIRSLPGHGGQAFQRMQTDSLFIYGKHDAIVDPPLKPGINERVIRAAHSAPVTNAPEVAAEIVGFLDTRR